MKSYQKKLSQRLGCGLLSLSLLLAAGCSTAEAPETQPENTAGESTGEIIPSQELPPLDAELNTLSPEDQQALLDYANQTFSPDVSMGYSYLGLAYLLDEDDQLREVYLPYGTDTDFELYQVTAANHGVSFTIYMTRDYTDAADALNNLSFRIPRPDGVENPQTHYLGLHLDDNDTVGMSMTAMTGDLTGSSDFLISQIVYADIKGDGYYMVVYMTFYPDGYDNQTDALIAEIFDCYAMTFPYEKEALLALIEAA